MNALGELNAFLAEAPKPLARLAAIARGWRFVERQLGREFSSEEVASLTDDPAAFSELRSLLGAAEALAARVAKAKRWPVPRR